MGCSAGTRTRCDVRSSRAPQRPVRPSPASNPGRGRRLRASCHSRTSLQLRVSTFSQSDQDADVTDRSIFEAVPKTPCCTARRRGHSERRRAQIPSQFASQSSQFAAVLPPGSDRVAQVADSATPAERRHAGLESERPARVRGFKSLRFRRSRSELPIRVIPHDRRRDGYVRAHDEPREGHRRLDDRMNTLVHPGRTGPGWDGGLALGRAG